MGGILGFLLGPTSPITDIINKIAPDANTKLQFQQHVMDLAQQGAFKDIDAQLAATAQQTDTNKVEASSASLFVSGWRPFIGWVCGSGLAYQYLVNPALSWTASIQHWPTPPTLDLGTLITMLAGLLGLGAARTVEKLNNAQGNH